MTKPTAEMIHELRTDRETSQSTREAVASWAAGLEPVYFQGAFARAHPGR